MDAQKAVSYYVDKILQIQGLKVLLLDRETTATVSAVCTQTHLLQHEVFLIAKLEATAALLNQTTAAHQQSQQQQQQSQQDNLKHLKAVVLVRPSADSIQALCEELRRPQYQEYHLHFTNVIKKSQIERIAECDGMELVKSLHEYYADYLALSGDLVSLGQSGRLHGDAPGQWDAQSLQRSVDGVMSVLLSLKKRPLIRHERNSLLCKRLGNELHAQINQEQQLFDFRRGDSMPVVYLLDRKNDPVTPLMSPWTYQAMVHELLGIDNGKVSLEQVPDIRAELKQVVLSAQSDAFYRKNMHVNLGDLSESIKQYVTEYQSKSHGNANIESISDMKRFVEDYPQFRQMSGNVSMHVAIVGELSRVVTRDGLLEVGELEQSLATVDNHQQDYKLLFDLLVKDTIPMDAKVRLVMLYALRYESSPHYQLPSLLEQLRRVNISDAKLAQVPQMIKFAGQQERLAEYSQQDFISKGRQLVQRGLKGVENVYEQHRPQLCVLLEALAKQRVRDQLYPYIDGGNVNGKERTHDVIIFMVGGVTYAEARAVEMFNGGGQQVNGGVRVLLAGNSLVNSRQFINQVQEASSRWASQRY